MRRVAIALVLLLLLLLGAGGAGADERSDELDSLRRAIEDHRERVSAFEREERGLLETLESMDRAVAALRRDAAQARREAGAARERLSAVQRELAGLEGKLDATRRVVSARVVSLYKAGDLGPVRALFAADSLREALARAEGLQRLLDHDRRLLRRFEGEREALDGARVAAAMARDDHDVAQERARRRLAEVDRERAARRDLLGSVRDDRRRTRAALNELEAAARALEETLDQLRESGAELPTREGAQPFAELRGRLDPPVEAAVASSFGRVVDAEFQTATFRKGVEFRTEQGDPVYAVADGVVRFAGWFRGYGRIVILDHGDDYFTVCGHLDEIAVAPGDAVREGDRLATAGETGSLTGPKLYFEVRRGSEALDPARWLRGGGER